MVMCAYDANSTRKLFLKCGVVLQESDGRGRGVAVLEEIKDDSKIMEVRCMHACKAMM
jgi:hypothetical protein